ncbi:xylulokinase [Tessaracoccus sp. ZS01]|uniref:xylulokinase n=1 Tax=Tessaracoccus sp. ZS01 TaxID=1906324 RepID=UPI00096E8E0D|nr:xylulokinase [Tessaracoccus sp. ZS01]MCG6567529.1 xylulokinase [Tessaracoccus sp. ZS01]OMG55895.1 xylulokinase [Tessaracoccus sp. ZS01]
MALVAGVDTSTQSCKVLIVDADSGAVVRRGQASHPDRTAVDPEHWWNAFQQAAEQAGGLDDVEALSVGGQQHGMVALDADGRVIRDALLWNDTRSAGAAADLRAEFDGWAEAVGHLPLASFTQTKLRWLADEEPDNAARVAAVALPHDWLTWRIRGARSLDDLVTDRSDASGTGYFDSVANEYRRDLLSLALRRDAANVVLPRVLRPDEGVEGPGFLIGPGAGDNAAAALGLGLAPGQTSLSIGTSGVVAAVSGTPVADATGTVNGFADATGAWLPLTATLNAARILDSARSVLGIDFDELARLALSAAPGAGGLTLVPWFEGERTPNLPDATASLVGMTLANFTPSNLARAAVEGLLGLLGGGLDAVRALGVAVERVSLIGGGAKSEAVRRIAPEVLGVPVDVPPAGEYVALGAARQAAWVLTGTLPTWELAGSETYEAASKPEIMERYRAEAERLAVANGWK